MSFTTRRLLSDSTSQYRIPNSLRFRSSASAYLSRTPASSSSDPRTWTFSAWVKRGTLGSEQYIVSAGNSKDINPNECTLRFEPTNELTFIWNGNSASIGDYWRTTAVFRDPSAWYHIVVRADISNTTRANRVTLYVNGVIQLFTALGNGANSSTTSWGNSSHIMTLGRASWAAQSPFDGYLTEVNFIDGQALDPLAFGNFSATTGVWTPARYTGTYGTNGFYLKFTDTSSNTATGIGKDSSGNGNNWTPNNISLTAGATYDSMIDTPTPYNDGGYGRGNYATLNPLDISLTGNVVNLQNGNLTVGATNGGGIFKIPNDIPFYFEIETANNYAFSFKKSDNPTAESSILFNFGGGYNTTSSPDSYYYRQQFRSGAGTIDTTNPGGDQIRTGTFGIAINKNTGNLQIYDDGVLIGTATFNNPSQIDAFEIRQNTSTLGHTVKHINFGQRPFAYTPPTGFKTLCTQNLPTPAIVNPAQYMAATTYAGTGATQTIANTVNNRSFQPDLVWIKGRSAATDHALYDSVRGATKDLVSNSTAAETTQATGLTTFGSTGFSIGNLAKLNTNAQTYVAWQWKAGDSTVTNTAGTITSQVDANPTAGFSIVSYTGTGASNPTIGHGLGIVPAMIICKNRDTATSAANDWFVYHKDTGAGYLMLLNKTDARATISGSTQGAIGTSPSTSTFTIAAGSIGSLNLNESGDRHLAYCFAEVDGYSKFGSYTGNGSADGPFLYCGFRPKWVMIKRTDSNVTLTNWFMYDSVRDTYNVSSNKLWANSSATEDTTIASLDFVSNGFKLRHSGATYSINESGGTYIFAAFAEAPFKYALAR